MSHLISLLIFLEDGVKRIDYLSVVTYQCRGRDDTLQLLIL